MKKIIRAVLTVGATAFFALPLHAATVRYIEDRATVQPGAKIALSSGTIRDLKVSSITFPGGSTIKEYVTGLSITSGTINDLIVSTVTFQNGATIVQTGSAVTVTSATVNVINSSTGNFTTLLKGKGTNTNDNAATGFIGETISSASVASSAFPATGVAGDLVAISLTPGDWLVSINVAANLSGATASGQPICWISIVGGNSFTNDVIGDSEIRLTNPTGSFLSSGSIPSYRLSLANAATAYLKYDWEYSGGPPRAWGRISAVRIR